MLFRPFYGVMYGFVIRIACVGCIYIRAYIMYKYMRACERDGCFCVALSSPLCCGFAVFIYCYDYFYIVPSLLLCLFCFILASNSYLCSIKWVRFCIAFSSILYPQRGKITIFCRCNSNLIEMQKQCNFSLKRQKMTRFSHKSIKN